MSTQNNLIPYNTGKRLLTKIDPHTLSDNDLVYIISDDLQTFEVAIVIRDANYDKVLYSEYNTYNLVPNDTDVYFKDGTKRGSIYAINSNILTCIRQHDLFDIVHVQGTPQLLMNALARIANDIYIGDIILNAHEPAIIEIVYDTIYDEIIITFANGIEYVYEPDEELTIIELQRL